MIGACKEDGRWAEALSLLFLMEDQQHPADVVSDMARLQGCHGVGDVRGDDGGPMVKIGQRHFSSVSLSMKVIK